MITVYKKCKDAIRLNDVYFNQNTAKLLDERAIAIIESIDQSEWVDKFKIKSRFDGTVLSVDKLSTGCKTALNIFYNPDKVFDICECGENALDLIYTLEQGNIYCAYPLISFEMDKVLVSDKKGILEIDDYDALKEWWLS